MELARTESPSYFRQWSNDSGNNAVAPPPARHHHAQSSSVTSMSNVKRAQNVAAQRLAKVMASQTTDDDDEDDDVGGGDDLGFRYGGSPPLSFGTTRFAGKSAVNLPALVVPPSKISRSSSPAFSRNSSVDEASNGRSAAAGRSPVSVPASQPPVPPSKLFQRNQQIGKRFLPEIGNLNAKDSKDQHEATALRDELDMLQEENESILEKLRLENERCKEAEARVREPYSCHWSSNG